MGVLKDYLESGRFSRGGKQQTAATAGIVILANIPLDADGHPRFSNLFLNLPEFADFARMKALFQAFEEKHLLLTLLDKSADSERARTVLHGRAPLLGQVSVIIGREMGDDAEAIEGCSIVAAPYRSAEGTLGTLGVIGPVRMNYSRVIALVDFTARLLGRVLSGEPVRSAPRGE